MKKDLVRLADLLDKRGESHYADLIDGILKMSNLEENINFSQWAEENISVDELKEIENEMPEIDRVMDNLYNSFE